MDGLIPPIELNQVREFKNDVATLSIVLDDGDKV